ncbi:MAG: LysM peptidoglycan-binding domain-containing protein [Desulfuromusa sp.]|nr:LysM peptidoglycan-binding domain-containing protein [Desulfuromusa sp.]
MKKFILTLVLFVAVFGGTSYVMSAQGTGVMYTVKKDDSISLLAKKYYGDVLKYKIIVDATNAKADIDSIFTHIENPNTISAGQVLWIPSTASLDVASPVLLVDADATTVHPNKENGTLVTVVDGGVSVVSSFDKIPASAGKTGGAFFRINSETERKVTGKKIKIEITASVSETSPDHQMGVAYSTAAVGNSGWHFVNLRKGKNTYSFEYKVPYDAKIKLGKTADFVGILSDKMGKRRSVTLHEMKVFVQ